MSINNKKEIVKMGAVISFDEAKKRCKNISNFSAGKKASNYSLLIGHTYLCEAKYKEQELNLLDNQIWALESKIRNINHQRNVDLYKASTSFSDAARKGCVESKKVLEKHFPEEFKDLQQKGRKDES